MKIPFYIDYSSFSNWVNTNFATLYVNDSIMFLSYVIINIAFLFLIIELLRVLKFVIIFIKNCIYR